jgi:hypothetical protein
MPDPLLLILVAITSFAAGYGTRSAVSYRRRTRYLTRYLKWEPYVHPSRPSQPPQFLMRSDNRNVTSMKRAASGGRRSN